MRLVGFIRQESSSGLSPNAIDYIHQNLDEWNRVMAKFGLDSDSVLTKSIYPERLSGS